MVLLMAVPARRPENSENLPATAGRTSLIASKHPYRAWEIKAAMMIAQGKPIGQVGKALVKYARPNPAIPEKVRIRRTINRIRKLQRTREDYRDFIYEQSLLRLEREIPDIFTGLTRKAKAGRVDAAKLILEVTGRHAPQTEVVPAHIHLNLTGVPRPQDDDVVDGEVQDAELEE